MTGAPMDDVDRSLLDRIQRGIPVVDRPWQAIAADEGATETAVLDRLRRLQTERLVSFLGPIYDTRAVGYRTSLVAMDVRPGAIESAAMAVSAYPGVSHCYERDNAFNLWSTLAVPPGERLATVARTLAGEAGCRRAVLLPERRRYKLRVHFAVGRAVRPAEADQPRRRFVRGTFSTADVAVLQRLQPGLPLVAEPFRELAGGDEASGRSLREALEEHVERGFVRRVAALVRHRNVGYVANAMAVWAVDDGAADGVGRILASHDAVSHCYLRRRSVAWPYGLYAMVHGTSAEAVRQVIADLTARAALPEPLVLTSGREFIKRRLQLFTPAYEAWHDERRRS